MQNKKILQETKEYYTQKIISYGATPLGVDWNSQQSQCLRFDQLLKICDPDFCFSLNDLGCGFGSLYNYMLEKKYNFSYCGLDVSEAMIETAQNLFGKKENPLFLVGSAFDKPADYSVASGIFNVKQNCSNEVWLENMKNTIHMLDAKSFKGFSFNCLTSYSDREKMQDKLFYADPGYFFDYCKKYFSKNVALLHDYGLYEFTILVRK